MAASFGREGVPPESWVTLRNGVLTTRVLLMARAAVNRVREAHDELLRSSEVVAQLSARAGVYVMRGAVHSTGKLTLV